MSLIYVSYAYKQKLEVLLCISMLLISKKKLNSDFKKIPEKFTGVNPHLLCSLQQLSQFFVLAALIAN